MSSSRIRNRPGSCPLVTRKTLPIPGDCDPAVTRRASRSDQQGVIAAAQFDEISTHFVWSLPRPNRKFDARRGEVRCRNASRSAPLELHIEAVPGLHLGPIRHVTQNVPDLSRHPSRNGLTPIKLGVVPAHL